MTADAHIPQEDLALFALQALAEEEATVVRAHLQECAVCRNEVAELSGDLALVALSAEPHAVPEGARERLLDKIAAVAEEEGRTAAKTVVSIADAKPVRKIYMSIP